MLPVSGSAAGEAQPTRCGGTSLWKMLNLYSQTTLPVSASSAMTRSCSVGAVAGRVLHVDAVAHDDRAPSARRRAPARGSSRRSGPISRSGPFPSEMPSRLRAARLRPVAQGDAGPAGARRGRPLCRRQLAEGEGERHEERGFLQHDHLHITYATAGSSVSGQRARERTYYRGERRDRREFVGFLSLRSRRSLRLSMFFTSSSGLQNVTPARSPNVRGAPLSPTNPDGARPGYGNATGM